MEITEELQNNCGGIMGSARALKEQLKNVQGIAESKRELGVQC